MRNLKVLIGLIVCSFCLLASPVAAQQIIFDQNILTSFAKIVRSRQYICQPCQQVATVDNSSIGMSYKVTCNNDLVYAVTVTPHSDMIVKPINFQQAKL